ncbi:SMC family ATPase [Candidatus Woesearchaeota archaeon]|nr:MAG: SMC family ATPase [Candidatus Woesearchaeota archaeon]
MRLHAITLENIRSYTHCTVTFPSGSVLLSGDIGSGKTTILLAIEFALFGTRRGELSGGMLLRHGARAGSVTLDATIAGKHVRITRTLKRTPNGVAQDAGALTIDGTVVECTAQELKARILSLLKYPPSLLTKKSLLFRYTVYTPQEEMKAILYEKADDRLDTLRKLFAMDTYKRARDNALLLVRELKRDVATLTGRLEELNAETLDAKSIEQRKQELLAARARRTAERAKLERRLRQEQEALAQLEQQRFEREELMKRQAVMRTRAESMQSRLEDFDKQLARLAEQIAATEQHLSPADSDEAALLKERAVQERQAALIEQKRRAIEQQRAKYLALAKQHEDVVHRVTKLAECPTCKQHVPAEHKQRITEAARAQAAQAQRKLDELASLAQRLAEKEAVLAKRRAETDQKLQLLEANKVKQAQLAKNKADYARLEQERAGFVQEREKLLDEVQLLAQQLAAVPPVAAAQYEKAKEALAATRAAREQVLVQLAEQGKELELLEKELARIAERAKERERVAAALAQQQRRVTWLSKQFINTAHAIEKTVFMSIYGLFNEYFRDWFSLLIEDETLSVRLNHDFAPLVVQNGYETELAHLSGGERTSVALAYRLALNRVINEFLDTIETRGLLVLDEPTDGFSTEQLDRVREVLDRLALEQVIIVSHEQQMEGYVDNVIRVEKREHESIVHE